MFARVRLGAAALWAVAGLAFAGCGAAIPDDPGGAATPAPSGSAPVGDPSPSPAVGSTTLRRLGFEYGPVDRFPVPLTAVIAVRVDQPNAVTLVLTRPPAEEVYAFYARELVGAGFSILGASPDAATLTFVGEGWRGSVTGDATSAAVTLRPA